MSSNYPAGDMTGSGIYDTEEVIYTACGAPLHDAEGNEDPDAGECNFSGAVDATIRGHRASWTCPECGSEHEEQS